MSYTETTTTSWLADMRNAVVGIPAGILLIGLSSYGLFWNESRAVQTYRALAEGLGLVNSIDSGAENSDNDGKLVHFTGPVKAIGTASDPNFNVTGDGALAIDRDVEMYQWVEETHSRSRETASGHQTRKTTYSYSLQWRSSRIDSSHFA